MSLPLEDQKQFGFIGTINGVETARSTVALADTLGYSSFWLGDHIEFPLPLMDPLVQIAMMASLSDKLTFGTGIYLLPLRHAVPVAKQVSSLDVLTKGRLIFGVGVGGEFANEYKVCGVPREERGARLSEGIEVLKNLFTGEQVSNADGRFYAFDSLQMKPTPHQKGGPPIWTGGRSEAALKRCGRLADGWFSYVVTPDMYREALKAIEAAANEAGRTLDRFGTGHLLFMRIDDTYDAAWDAATEHLSQRYAMDFRDAAQKYCALGRPEDVAERVNAYHEAGCRHIVLDCTGPFGDRDTQLERFAREVMPLLK